jgi:hypothetical protein
MKPNSVPLHGALIFGEIYHFSEILVLGCAALSANLRSGLIGRSDNDAGLMKISGTRWGGNWLLS